MRTSTKCQKMKNARAKRAKLLYCFFVVKYANLWGFCCRRRRGCSSSLFAPLWLLPLFHFHRIQTVYREVRKNYTDVRAAELNEEKWWFTVAQVVIKTENEVFHVVVLQRTVRNCSKVRAARAARLFFVIQPTKLIIWSVGIPVTVVYIKDL